MTALGPMTLLTPFSSLFHFLIEKKDLIGAITGASTLTGLALKAWPKLITRWRETARRYELQRKINALDYTDQDIERAIEYYIEPECQVVDPSGTEDFRRIYPVRQNLFEVVDDLLTKQTANRFSLLLGDTGMGKTSFLLNYYARHWRGRRRRQFSIKLIPLGAGDALGKITSVPNKSDTVLLLDALDEDPMAIEDHRQRFDHLIKASSPFRHVVITCRTQFFSHDDEIPKEAGIIKVGPIGPGDTRQYIINKLYLSPFSEEQIRHYLWRRFPSWQLRKRRTAFALVKKIEDLPARPMLLAQIELILSLREECKYSFQIYEQMIQSWLNREKGIAEPALLREFCECLAVDIFENRKERGGERIRATELPLLATKFGLQLPRIEHIRTRSLLNRDAQGNLKFAHRSILEYLFVSRFRKFPSATPRVEWTDQMKQFYWETSFDAWEKHKIPIAFPGEADLRGLEHLRVRPVVTLRNQPTLMTGQQLQEVSSLAEQNSARVERAPHFYRTIEFESSPDDVRDSVRAFCRQYSDDHTGGGMRSRLAAALSTGYLKIVVDHALGLAWEIPGDEALSEPEVATSRANILSHLKIGGFVNWRLPTVEEVFSLANLCRQGDFVSLFHGLGNRIWTADRYGVQRISVNISSREIRTEGLSQPTGRWPRAVCVVSVNTGDVYIRRE